MKLIPAVTVVLFALVAAPLASGACNLDPRYENGVLRWDSPSGATQFSVLELIDGLAPVYFTTKANSVTVTRRATAAVTARYVITAEIVPGTQAIESRDACTATIEVELPVDAALRRLTRKVVIPVAGSTPGAFGGKFRTALELRGVGTMRGRVVFHPAGKVASDDDPSLPYSFVGNPILSWDDVVETMGQSGIGSIDIVPDEGTLDIVPQVTARLYNDTSIGTFGSYVPAVLPYSYLRARSMEVPIPDARSRVNVGVTTFGPTKVRVVIYAANGRLAGFKDHSFAAGWTQMTSASDFAGEAIGPGQSLVLLVEGSAVLFYTVTENQTNDPTVVLNPSHSTTRNVGIFVD